jgi:HAD superfamily hydrolase (TIGR01450 family)
MSSSRPTAVPSSQDPPIEGGQVTTVLCDLDGVVWLAHRPLPGAAEAIAALRSSGRRVLFVTNNSVATLDQHAAALDEIGIPAEGDVVSSATAAASLLEPGCRALVVGGAGIAEAIERRGATAVANEPGADRSSLDAVVVGLDRELDYPRLARASTAIRRGARFVATNDDATYPTPDGPQPGGGSIVAAVSVASGEAPIVAGKPHAPMASHILELLGADAIGAGEMVVVGDRPSTEGRFAAQLECPFVLVRSGVVEPGASLPSDVPVAADLPDLAALPTLLGELAVPSRSVER